MSKKGHFLPKLRRYIFIIVLAAMLVYFVLVSLVLSQSFDQHTKHRSVLFSVIARQLNSGAVALPVAVFHGKTATIKVSVTHQPKADSDHILLSDVSIKSIQAMLDQHRAISLSYQLPHHQGLWLNYSQEPSWSLYYKVAAFFIGFLIILAFLGFYSWVSTVYNIAIQKIKQSTDQLGVDINTNLMSVKGMPVLRETSDMLFKMQKKIRDLINYRTRMLSTISHDLRTPITRLKLKAEQVADPVLKRRLNQDLDQMNAMINELLVFAKQDLFKEKKVKLNLSDLLQTICYEFIDLEYPVTDEGIESKVPFYGAKIGLQRCFTNIIQNAIKYGQSVKVSLTVVGQEIHIVFEDTGPGIAEKEMKEVFKPFYRSDAGKRASSTGTGLGLSIVQEIIQYHEGAVFLKNGLEKGLVVTITLPFNLPSAKASGQVGDDT